MTTSRRLAILLALLASCIDNALADDPVELVAAVGGDPAAVLRVG